MADYSIPHTAAYGVQAYALSSLRPQGQGEGAPFSPTASASDPAQPSGDQVSLSPAGKRLSAGLKASALPEQGDKKTGDTKQPATKGKSQQPLNEAQLRQINQLKKRDNEVRTHEQAHLAAAGQYATGGPSYSYQTGADGRQYAVGGSVPIDTGAEPTPEATIMKMRTVKRAALAPADPSAADRQIAAQAAMQEMQAIQVVQAQQLPGNQNAPSGAAGEKESKPAEVPVKNNSPKSPDTLSTTNEPSDATRTMMSTAYKAMASLA